MKTYFCIALVLFITVTEGIAATSIDKISQWPYTSTLPFLQPSPNSVATGEHRDYAEGIIIWAVGDTISILNANDLIEIKSFQVNTNKTIYDFYYRFETSIDGDVTSETLYLALGTNGLQIFDLTDLSPSADLSTPVSIYAVSTADPGYQIDFITKKNGPTTAIDATGVGYYDNHIFLSDMNFGLRVIDVSDTTEPLFETLLAPPVEILLGTEWTYNPSNDQYEYIDKVITRTSGYIQPNISGLYDVTGGYNNLEVISYNHLLPPVGERTYAFVHDYYYGLRVFDVTDPTIIEPPVSKFMVTDDWLLYTALLNDIYVAVGSDYDEEEPTDRLYAYVTAVDSIGSSAVVRLDVLSDDGVLESVVIDDREFPSITNIGRHITEIIDGKEGVASGVYVAGDHAYVANGITGLQIVDISTGVPINDNTPVLNYDVVGSYDNGNMGALSLVGDDGNKIYLHDALGGLHEIDVTDNEDPIPVSTTAPPISGDSVYVDDGFAYCLDSDDGFRIFDISEPTALILDGFYDTTGIGNNEIANDISVFNNYAYIAKGSAGLEIVDVTTKTAPVLAGALDTLDDAVGAVAVATYQNSGVTYACVADSSGGFAVINVNAPASPGPSVVVAGTGTVNDVSVSGDYAYLAENSGLTIVELSEVDSSGDPVYSIAASTTTDGNAIAVSVFTGADSKIYALISDPDGIMIKEVTITATAVSITPINESTIETIAGQPFVCLEVIDNYLFASAGTSGVYVYDLSVLPATPIRFGDFDGIFPSKEVFPFIKDEGVYFASAEETNGIAVYDLNFGTSLGAQLSDSDESKTCFISSLEY